LGARSQSVCSVHSTFNSVQTFWMLLTTSDVALGWVDHELRQSFAQWSGLKAGCLCAVRESHNVLLRVLLDDLHLVGVRLQTLQCGFVHLLRWRLDHDRRSRLAERRAAQHEARPRGPARRAIYA